MTQRLRNIIEDIASDFLDKELTWRSDICDCPACKRDMLAYILSRIPAKYVTTESGALYTLIEQTRVEYEALIGHQIIKAIEIVSKNPRHKLAKDTEQNLELLLNKIRQDRGIDFRHYRKELLKRRLSLRMRAHNLNSYSEYLRFLIKKPEEYDELFGVLCINVSEFFRDPEVWITIKMLLENLIQQKMQKNDKEIRIWSAGCASGEEPYSLAILLREILKGNIPNFFIKIYATDIDPKCLKDILKAEYPKNQLKNIDSKLLHRYFILSKEEIYTLKQEIKDMVESKSLDLTSEETIKDIDVILCRNVFIYFHRSLQELILMKFYKSLKTKGYLVMGKVELILNEARDIFEEVDANARVYQKK